MDLTVHKGETERQYIWRTSQYVRDGKITWKGLTDEINKNWRIPNGEPARCESAYRKGINSAIAYYNEVFSKMNGSDFSNDLDKKKRELEKERKKLQSEKIEYNRWLRENARDELIVDKIVEAVREFEPLETPDTFVTSDNNKEGVLAFGDLHYGVEFEIKGLFGETINAYSPEIFEKRMWYLYNKVCEIVNKENLSSIYVIDLADNIDGIIRLTSQLMKLRYGVIESTVKVANFLAEWLNKLSNIIHIKFSLVLDGNHDQLRLCGAPKNAFKDENMSVIIKEIIRTRLENNPNVEILDNPTGHTFLQICNYYNILAIHGEVKNLGKTIDDFSRSYGVPIDYLIAGHKHHKETVEIGRDIEAISVGSVIGIDSYGLSLNKTSNPSATFLVFEEDLGKSIQYDIKLPVCSDERKYWYDL